jgi:hypothetical protein
LRLRRSKTKMSSMSGSRHVTPTIVLQVFANISSVCRI